jgi:hypothetical protein
MLVTLCYSALDGDEVEAGTTDALRPSSTWCHLWLRSFGTEKR